MNKPIDWRGLLARLPLPMLALAASYGVYSFAALFVPTFIAGVQAAAFELTYIGLAVSRTLDTAQRKRATAISIGAVVTSIVYNTLAGWFHKVPGLLESASPLAWLCFAILHGAPLAWVAYLVADLLLHIAAAPTAAAPQPADAPTAERTVVGVSAALLPVYTAILETFERNPTATTAELSAATGFSDRTMEARRAQLVRLGALHRSTEGYRRNGVELVAEE